MAVNTRALRIAAKAVLRLKVVLTTLLPSDDTEDFEILPIPEKSSDSATTISWEVLASPELGGDGEGDDFEILPMPDKSPDSASTISWEDLASLELGGDGEGEDFEVVTVPASGAAIAALKEARLEKCGDSSCSICLEELSDGDEKEAVSLPCSHVYHKDCILQWLEIDHFCPLCRHPMPSIPN